MRECIGIFCLLLGIHVISGDDCFIVDKPSYAVGRNILELSFKFEEKCIGNSAIEDVTVSRYLHRESELTLQAVCQILHTNGTCVPGSNDTCKCNLDTHTYEVKQRVLHPQKETWLLKARLKNESTYEHEVYFGTPNFLMIITEETSTPEYSLTNQTSTDGDSIFDQLDTTHLVFIAVGVSLLAIAIVIAMACIMCHTKRNFFLRWRPADNVAKAARNSVDQRGTTDQHQETPETSRATPPPSAARVEKNQRGGGSSGTLPLTNYCDVQDSMSAANAASLARRPPAAVPKFAAPDLSGDGSAYDEVNYEQVSKPPKARGPVKAPKPTPLDTAAADLEPHETYDHLNAYQQRFRKEKRSPAFGKVKVIFTSNPLSNQP